MQSPLDELSEVRTISIVANDTPEESIVTTPQDQYRDLVQQSQQAMQSAVETWTRTVQDTVTSLPTNPTQVDPGQVVDQVFDFAERMLEMQRDFTKNLLQSSAALSQSVTRQSGQDSESSQSGGQDSESSQSA